MKLSIITINYNDAAGLKCTLDSVAAQQLAISPSRPLTPSPTIAIDRPQSPFELEHIIIDGGSKDGSVEVIKDYESSVISQHLSIQLKWVSEKDKGVYNAMNKGILMATGDYIQILNSGDIYAGEDVVARMYEALRREGEMANGVCPEILYGNMMKAMPKGKMVRDNCGGAGVGESFLYFYTGTLNHDCAWIRRTLFVSSSQPCFGLYDEEMKICSDWKWYVDAIAIGGVKPVYVDIDVTIFDMNGISESGGKHKAIIQKERRDYIEKILPKSVLFDYDTYSFPMSQYRRLKRYHLWGMICFLERVLFKLEKWELLK